MQKLFLLLAALAVILAGLAGCGPEKDPWEANLKAIPTHPRPSASVGGGPPPTPAPEQKAPEKKGSESRDEKTGGNSKTKAAAG